MAHKARRRRDGWQIRDTGEGERVDVYRRESIVQNDLNDVDEALSYINRSRYSGEPIVHIQEGGYIRSLTR